MKKFIGQQVPTGRFHSFSEAEVRQSLTVNLTVGVSNKNKGLFTR
jgi:Arc/MetJ-type ribon-helix-helix transcriptional regulator